MRVPTINK